MSKLGRILWFLLWPCVASFLVGGWAYHAGYERGVTQTKAAIFDVLDRMAVDKT